MAELGLNASAQVVLDGTGYGVATLGPGVYGVRWSVTRASVSTSTAVDTPTCNLYQGSPSAGNRLGGTYSGQQDDTDLAVTLTAGEMLTAVWEGGDAGAIATLSVFGTKYVPGA